MSGIFLHSPHQQCAKDCCPISPCANKGERIYIRGRQLVACVHTTEAAECCPRSPQMLTPCNQMKMVEKSPIREIHASDCFRKGALSCPFGRCDGKYKDLFEHLKNSHDFIRVSLNIPLVYRLKNITRDMFIIYEAKNDVFFVGNIEDSYQKYISFEMQVIYNYKKKCCMHPKFVLTIPGFTNNSTIDVYKTKGSFGKVGRRIQILKDDLKKPTGGRFIYDMDILVKQVI